MTGDPLPAGWTRVRISEVGDIRLGRQRSPKNHRGPSMRAYLRVANVLEDRIDSSDVMQMNFDPDEYVRYKLQPGDVLLNEGQSPEFLGRPAIYKGQPPDVAFTNTLIRFRASGAVEPRWALAVFRHYMHSGRFAREARITTNIAHLSTNRFASIELPVPPQAEQVRIVSELERRLSHLDAAVVGLQRCRSRLRSARQSVLEAAMSGQLTEQRAEDWSERRLGDLAVLVKNGMFVSRPGLAPIGTAILRISAVRSLRLALEDVRYAVLDDSAARPYLLNEDDLLFIRYNGNPELVGACGRVKGLSRPTTYPDKLIRVVVNREQVLPGFLELAAAAGETRRCIRVAVKTTAGQAGISGGDLKRVLVRFPDIESQHAIVAEVDRRLSLIHAAQRTVEQNLAKANRLRRALLAEAIAGRLVAQDPLDEPADVLLARVHRLSHPAARSRGRRGRPGGYAP